MAEFLLAGSRRARRIAASCSTLITSTSPRKITASIPTSISTPFPTERVAQIHIAGHTKYERYILDTHDHPVLDPVWKIYERAIARIGRTATLLEWDDRIPSFEEVHAEALKANNFLPHANTIAA